MSYNRATEIFNRAISENIASVSETKPWEITRSFGKHEDYIRQYIISNRKIISDGTEPSEINVIVDNSNGKTTIYYSQDTISIESCIATFSCLEQTK